MSVTMWILTLAFMILSIFDTLKAKNLLQMSLFFLVLTLPPLLDCLKHGLLTLAILITMSWVVEDLKDVVNDVVDILAIIRPCTDNAWNDEFDGCDGDLASYGVENVGKVVFGEHGVCWIGAVVVLEDFVLTFQTGLEDAFGG